MNQPLLTTKEAAAFFQLSPHTLILWRRQKTGPPFIRIGTKKIRYDPADIATWINRCRAIPQYESPKQGF